MAVIRTACSPVQLSEWLSIFIRYSLMNTGVRSPQQRYHSAVACDQVALFCLYLFQDVLNQAISIPLPYLDKSKDGLFGTDRSPPRILFHSPRYFCHLLTTCLIRRRVDDRSIWLREYFSRDEFFLNARRKARRGSRVSTRVRCSFIPGLKMARSFVMPS